jgi:phosphonate transport system substrate-binding protein
VSGAQNRRFPHGSPIVIPYSTSCSPRHSTLALVNTRTYSSPRRLRSVFALLAAGTLVLAACGGDDDAADTTEAPAEEPAAAETTAAPAEEPAVETTAAPAAEPAADPKADWPSRLTFAAVPAENAEEISSYVTPQIIADELGVEMEFVQAADYAGVIEGMVAERVDIGSFGAFSYVIATGAGADIDVAGLWASDTPDTIGDYRSYLIVPVGSDIQAPADLAGKKVCFVDPGSTSGFLFPSAALLAEGLDPSETSTDIEAIFAGGHDASAIAVNNGDCDAGFAYDTMITEQLIESGDIPGVIDLVEDETVNEADATIQIIWKSTPIAAPPLAFGNWLPESMQEEIVDIVTTKVNVDWAVENGYCASADDCPLSDGPFWGYLAGEDSYYDGIRELCELTGSSKCNL